VTPLRLRNFPLPWLSNHCSMRLLWLAVPVVVSCTEPSPVYSVLRKQRVEARAVKREGQSNKNALKEAEDFGMLGILKSTPRPRPSCCNAAQPEGPDLFPAWERGAARWRKYERQCAYLDLRKIVWADLNRDGTPDAVAEVQCDNDVTQFTLGTALFLTDANGSLRLHQIDERLFLEPVCVCGLEIMAYQQGDDSETDSTVQDRPLLRLRYSRGLLKAEPAKLTSP
jgi:hypothetical protein